MTVPRHLSSVTCDLYTALLVIMPAKHLRITGRVQGVFFRASSQKKGLELGLRGWVRNEPDGSVSIHAEGDTEALQQFTDWCSEGPPAANVENVQTQEVKEEGHTSFTIER